MLDCGGIRPEGPVISKSFDAIVIGSGLGGLTAGALFARGGAKVLVLERNASFGGAATTYRHGALMVEASLHETSPPHAPGGISEIYRLLEIGTGIEFVPVANLHEIRCPLIGSPFILPHGPDALEAHLIERFPHQKRNIRSFLRQLWQTHRFIEYVSGKHDGSWLLRHAGELPLGAWAVFRDLRASLSDVLTRRFGADEAIKFALAANLPYFTDDPDTFWWLGYAAIQGTFLRGGGAYIKGGSQVLSDRLVEIIREAGGEALNGCEAVAIELGENGDARGVRYRSTREGTQIVADAPVIFANAARHVIEGMLPADRRREFMEPFGERPLSISLFSATIGLNKRPLAFGISSYSTQLIPAWMQQLSDFKHNADLLGRMPAGRMPAMAVVDYSQIDSGLTQNGVFPVNVVCPDRLDNWHGLSDDAYHQRKDAWLTAIIDHLDAEWPGIADAVVEKTAATARTMHEYLNTPGGAIYGFALRPPERISASIPMRFSTSVEGLWLASAYAGLGGFAGAMACGALAAYHALRSAR